jgi:hypothetical protein
LYQTIPWRYNLIIAGHSYVVKQCPDIDTTFFNEIPVSRFNNFFPSFKCWSSDFSKVVYDYHSVVFLAIQFAIYAGFSEIYLLGVDCNYDTKNLYASTVDHGIRQDREYIKNNGLVMINDFSLLKKHIEEKKIPVSIYNASSGGMLNVFKRVSLEKILDEKKRY